MKKLLVANRGEIACRVFRTARRMGIATVAVCSEPDRFAPHVRQADETVCLNGSTATETYLDAAAILAAAMVTGADAIHPGYGFLSENAEFARSCGEAGIAFVGPSPEVIDLMGSKVTAKRLMAAAGVPILPGGLVSEGYRVPPGGFPVLVKAAYGGGGRGMRIARTEAELAEVSASASREAAAAFGDGTVFLERYVEDPRHIEVQIFGDAHGKVLHLFERECSIQRRYQKVIEEAPSPAVGPELRAALCAAAVAAGEALGYVGAGTVEFIVDQRGEPAFLEVNTRLQVEHPVTELVTGLDLVELQLRVAQGEPLDVTPSMRGHAIEARLYAEDVPNGFVPASGHLDRFELGEATGIRVDAGYETGSTVSTHYDAMLAKVIAVAEDRVSAATMLAEHLAGSRVHGVPTNRDLLVGVLRHPEFLEGHTDTGFLERHDPLQLIGSDDRQMHTVAAAIAAQAEDRAAARVQATTPSGWRNVATAPQRRAYSTGDEETIVEYRFDRDGIRVWVDDTPLEEVTLWHADPSSVDLSVGGIRRRFEVHRATTATYVDGSGPGSVLVEVDRLPLPAAAIAVGSMVAALPGLVSQRLVDVGEEVIAGQTLLVLEAMKMEHGVRSPGDGVVREIRVEVGDQVTAGQLLAVVEGLDDA